MAGYCVPGGMVSELYMFHISALVLVFYYTPTSVPVHFKCLLRC
jgi:hypothetical protein